MSIEIEAQSCSFTLPGGWSHVPQRDVSRNYFEREDKLWGAYVKTLDFTASEKSRSPSETAAYVQQVHKEAFCGLPNTNWKVVGIATTHGINGAASTLDLYDESSTYRIVSRVIVAGPLAAHITLHNYLCDDLRASDRESTAILLTVRELGADT